MKRLAFTVEELAKLTGAAIHGNPQLLISGISDLRNASAADLSFFSDRLPLSCLKQTQAGAVLIQQKHVKIAASSLTSLVVENPSKAFQIIAAQFIHLPKSAFQGIHPTAVIAQDVSVGEGVTIGPHVVIDHSVIVGKNTFIGAGSYIGAESKIGEHCLIHPRVTILERSQIKDRVVVHSGVVIGSDGFGFHSETADYQKIPQIGIVIIEEDVEIGANTTIDRARFGTTSIGKGSKLDNLIQIGHNVQIGEQNLIAAQTGIAGSTKTGARVMIGGQVGINGHIEIASGTRLAARCAVFKSIGPGDYSGNPAIPIQQHNKNTVLVKNIQKLVERIKILENQTRS